jgi:hypothetical protein
MSALSSASKEGMTCQRGDPPESRNGGPIPPFLQEKLSEDAALAGSDSHNDMVGSSKPISYLGPFRRNLPLSDPPASAASEFFSQRKRDRSPRDGGPINRLPIRFYPPTLTLPHQWGGNKILAPGRRARNPHSRIGLQMTPWIPCTNWTDSRQMSGPKPVLQAGDPPITPAITNQTPGKPPNPDPRERTPHEQTG